LRPVRQGKERGILLQTRGHAKLAENIAGPRQTGKFTPAFHQDLKLAADQNEAFNPAHCGCPVREMADLVE